MTFTRMQTHTHKSFAFVSSDSNKIQREKKKKENENERKTQEFALQKSRGEGGNRRGEGSKQMTLLKGEARVQAVSIHNRFVLANQSYSYSFSEFCFPFCLMSCVAECNWPRLVRVLGSRQQVTLVALRLYLFFSLPPSTFSFILSLPL